MKAIIISVKPQWVEKILNGEKTIEIRKTKPSCDLPCKVYIYETKGKKHFYNYIEACECPNEEERIKFWEYGCGKVVAEFTLNKIDTIEICDPFVFRNNEQEDWWWFKSYACLDCEEIMSYIGYGNDHDGWGNEYDKGYAWHIDNLKIYDKPKELSEFKTYCSLVHNKKNVQCFSILCRFKNECKNHLKPIIRPPQSWCYCNDLGDINEK